MGGKDDYEKDTHMKGAEAENRYVNPKMESHHTTNNIPSHHLKQKAFPLLGAVTDAKHALSVQDERFGEGVVRSPHTQGTGTLVGTRPVGKKELRCSKSTLRISCVLRMSGAMLLSGGTGMNGTACLLHYCAGNTLMKHTIQQVDAYAPIIFSTASQVE
ncbi:hypothetical protein E2C01_026667 [Portunus trituberculatus]|uniref:Uncharacterized protein n=1 Tax=Portunus trituberculatus TaxID=210409 RepID=A0A5B7EJU2_PORTR|nr:hypothetical protein [Portunus trituberculatus]